MITPEDFDRKYQHFKREYMIHFDSFWNYKLGFELSGDSILDKQHRLTTQKKLKRILSTWRAYRGVNLRHKWSDTLLTSLEAIAEPYAEIRSHTLMEFSTIAEKPLSRIWHELGRVKEETAVAKQTGSYNIIAIGKPLMLLWGQTLAFDANVRNSCPLCSGSKRMHLWTFEEWIEIMHQFEQNLKSNQLLVNHFEILNEQKFKTTEFIPYGRYLDIYYWSKYDLKKKKVKSNEN